MPARGRKAAGLAAPPERFHSGDSGSEPGVVHCDGFDIDLATAGSESFTVYLDGSGEVVKVLVRTQQLFVRIGDTDEFTHSLTGYRFMATDPGRGVVIQDVGRIEYVGDQEDIVFLAGQHHAPDDENAEEVFCAALSG